MQLVHCYWIDLRPDNLGSFPSGAFGFNCVITSSKGFVHTILPGSPSYPSNVKAPSKWREPNHHLWCLINCSCIIILYYVILRYVALRYITLHHVTSRHVRYVTLRHIVSYRVASHHIILHYIILYYTILDILYIILFIYIYIYICTYIT